MNGKHHSIAGLCTATCLTATEIAYHCPQNWHEVIPIAGMVVATYIGSLFPDIDTRTSKLGKKMKISSAIVSKLFGHRGFFHSPLFVAIAFLLCWRIFLWQNIMDYSVIFLGFIAGMLTHLACDMATKGGLPLFYPYNRKRFSISVIESGSKWEWIPLTFICLLSIGLTVLSIVKGWTVSTIFI